MCLWAYVGSIQAISYARGNMEKCSGTKKSLGDKHCQLWWPLSRKSWKNPLTFSSTNILNICKLNKMFHQGRPQEIEHCAIQSSFLETKRNQWHQHVERIVLNRYEGSIHEDERPLSGSGSLKGIRTLLWWWWRLRKRDDNIYNGLQ